MAVIWVQVTAVFIYPHFNPKGEISCYHNTFSTRYPTHLIGSHWVRGYEEHNGHCEDAFYARFGPLHLELNHCFVLDHDDAQLSVLLTPWGRLRAGYVVCRGEEQIYQPGFYTTQRSLKFCE